MKTCCLAEDIPESANTKKVFNGRRLCFSSEYCLLIGIVDILLILRGKTALPTAGHGGLRRKLQGIFWPCPHKQTDAIAPDEDRET